MTQQQPACAKPGITFIWKGVPYGGSSQLPGRQGAVSWANLVTVGLISLVGLILLQLGKSVTVGLISLLIFLGADAPGCPGKFDWILVVLVNLTGFWLPWQKPFLVKLAKTLGKTSVLLGTTQSNRRSFWLSAAS